MLVIQYSREQLLAFKNKPECQTIPDFSHLDPEIRDTIVRRQIPPLNHARAILNKLTPETFENLTSVFIDVIERAEDSEMNNIAKIVVEKAYRDLKFSKLYAKFSSRVSNEEHEWNLSERKKRNFVIALVQECQKCFETVLRRSNNDDFSDIEKKDFEGIVRFIAELYKCRVIQRNIPFICANHMMQNINDYTVEQLCKLVQNCGELMEKVNNAEMNKISAFLKAIRQNPVISKRIVFLVDDTANLRRERWVKKHNYQKPDEPGLRTAVVTNAVQKPPGWKKSNKYQEQKQLRQQHHHSHHHPQQKRQGSGGGKPDNNDRRRFRGKGNRGDNRKSIMTNKQEIAESKRETTTADILSHDEMERKVKNIYEEYLQVKSNSEMKEYFSEFEKYTNSSEIAECFVRVVVQECIWKKDSELHTTQQLFAFLFETKLADPEIFKTELDTIIDMKEDLRIDIPKIEHVIEIISSNATGQ